jgi:hypothetical protein
MKTSAIKTIVALSMAIFCAGNLTIAQETLPAFSTIDLFYQGGANNCASIALIKAAMHKYGRDKIFTVEKGNNKYKLILRDGTKLTISDEELALAKSSAKFLLNSKTTLEKPQQDDVMFHAYLAYAAIAKYIEEKGYWGCEEEDGSSLHLGRIKKFTKALKFITRTSYCTDNAHRLLGLRIANNRVSKLNPRTKLMEQGIILYSTGHAVAMYNNLIDCRGEWKAVSEEGRGCDNLF